MPPEAESEGNSPKKRLATGLLSFEAAAAFSVAIVLVFSFATYLARSFIETGQLAAVISATLVELANLDRSEGKLGTLSISPTLTEAAQAKANDMAEKGYFAHVSPEGNDSWYWFRKAGYQFSYAGENLAVNFSDSEDVERAWMDSPSHRANILNGRFTEIGIATAIGTYKGRQTTFVVQMFGAPSKAQAAAVRTISGLGSSTETSLATTEPVATTSVLGAASGSTVSGTAAGEPGSVSPAPVTALTPSAPISFFDRLVSSPRNLLHEIYIAASFLLLVVLAFATELEFKKHHTRHVVVVGCLLLLMLGLSIIADYFIFTKPILG